MEICNLLLHILQTETLEGCVRYIFASFVCLKESTLKTEFFLFHFEHPFRSGDNQTLTFQIFKCHEVIK